MFSLTLRTGGVVFEVPFIEDYPSFEAFSDGVKKIYIDSTGGDKWLIDVGDNRCPHYIEKPRLFKNKYWKNLVVKKFMTSNGPITTFDNKPVLEVLEQIFSYVQENKEKIIWSNARIF